MVDTLGFNQVTPGTIRQMLTSTLNLYVAPPTATPAGNDITGTGTAAAPFATIQRAWTVLTTSYDLAGSIVNINVADGTYTSGLSAAGLLYGQTNGVTQVNIIGNITTPNNCYINSSGNCFLASNGAAFTVSGFKLASSGASGILSVNDGVIFVGQSMIYGTCAAYHVLAEYGGSVAIQNNYSIIGGAACHLLAAYQGTIAVYPGLTVTISNTPAFTSAFAYSEISSIITFQGTAPSFTGTGTTGPRYAIQYNSVITGTGGGANYFPGNASGGVYTGSQYN